MIAAPKLNKIENACVLLLHNVLSQLGIDLMFGTMISVKSENARKLLRADLAPILHVSILRSGQIANTSHLSTLEDQWPTRARKMFLVPNWALV